MCMFVRVSCVCVCAPCTCVCVCVCVYVVCTHICNIMVIQGTQKSIDKARELIDEVLSRPDKEYEAAKHQLGHSSSHYQQQNRSYEVQQDTVVVVFLILVFSLRWVVEIISKDLHGLLVAANDIQRVFRLREVR